MRAPGPRGHPLLGSYREFLREPLAFLPACRRRYGELFQFRVGPLRRMLALCHPDHVHEVLTQKSDSFHKTSTTVKALGKGLGLGLLTTNAAQHRRQRALAQPAFHARRIAGFADVMVAYAARACEVWKPGELRPIDRDMTELTLRVVAKTLFDSEIPEEAAYMGDAMQEMQRIAREELASPLSLPLAVPTRANRAMRRATAQVDAIVLRLIAERRAAGDDRGDLLSMLLRSEDERGARMDDREVRDQCITLFAAGHETTASLITWVLHELSRHPEIEARLQAEVDAVLGGRPATAADLPRLPYNDQVVQETLRLWPPVWAWTRAAVEDVEIGGCAVPKGAYVILCPWVTHRDPTYFPDPERFDPERFAPERAAGLARHAFYPFGRGARVCIGQAFAVMEARLVVATLAQRVRLHAEPGRVEPEALITLQPRGGLRLRVEPRPG